MVVEVDVIIHQSVVIPLSLSPRHPCSVHVGQETRQRTSRQGRQVMEVETKFAWDVPYSMDCTGLRTTANRKGVLP